MYPTLPQEISDIVIQDLPFSSRRGIGRRYEALNREEYENLKLQRENACLQEPTLVEFDNIVYKKSQDGSYERMFAVCKIFPDYEEMSYGYCNIFVIADGSRISENDKYYKFTKQIRYYKQSPVVKFAHQSVFLHPVDESDYFTKNEVNIEFLAYSLVNNLDIFMSRQCPVDFIQNVLQNILNKMLDNDILLLYSLLATNMIMILHRERNPYGYQIKDDIFNGDVEYHNNQLTVNRYNNRPKNIAEVVSTESLHIDNSVTKIDYNDFMIDALSQTVEGSKIVNQISEWKKYISNWIDTIEISQSYRHLENIPGQIAKLNKYLSDYGDIPISQLIRNLLRQ
jgi:hypothetical protein